MNASESPYHSVLQKQLDPCICEENQSPKRSGLLNTMFRTEGKEKGQQEANVLAQTTQQNPLQGKPNT